MALIVTIDGSLLLLDRMLRGPSAPPFDAVLRLYSNTYAPLKTSVFADFVECTFASYLPIVLNWSVWQAPFDFFGEAHADYGTAFQEFLNTGPDALVYGTYVTSSADNTVLWAEAFPPGILVPTGNKFRVAPGFGAESKFS